jgi:hypothetical protein
MASELKEQLEAVRRETSTWPAWRKMEIEAEVAKTPLRKQPEGKKQSSRKTETGESSGGSNG